MKTLRATEWYYPVNHNYTISYRGEIFNYDGDAFGRMDVLEFARKNGFTHVLWDYSDKRSKREKV